MLSVTIVCCDSGCWEERELLVESLEQLDEGACDCGYAFVVTRVAEARA